MEWSKNPLIINFKHNRVRITAPLAHLLVSPLKRKFIVSYPRSGSTWMRTMLTNVIDPESDSNPNVFNRMIPGATLTRLWLAYTTPPPHILSTHSMYRSSIKRVAYIVRNGRDSMLSLYRYTTVRVGSNMEFDTWFSFYMRGWYGPRWDQQVESWIGVGREKLKDDMLIIRYEDCCNNPHGELQRVCDFFGLKYSSTDLDRAVEMSSIDNMRKWENRLLGNIKDTNASFYRGNEQAKEWDTLLSEEQKEMFMNCSRTALYLGGYI